MTVTARIHCLTDAEPPSFHGTAGVPKAYAVNLNIECETDAPFDDPSKDRAHAAFKLFLEKAGGASFYLFEAKFGLLPGVGGAPPSGKTGVTALTLLYKIGGGAGQGDVVSEPALDSAPLLNWLEEEATRRRNTPKEDERSYWLVASGANPDGAAIDQTAIGATHELRAAHAWNAPVAHRFGLTSLLLLPITDDDLGKTGTFRLVLVSFDGSTPAPDVTTIEPFPDDKAPDTVDIPYDMGASFAVPTVCRAARLQLPPKDFPGLVTADGYLQVDSTPDAVRRFLNLFEERAATLMSAMLALTRTFSSSYGQPQSVPLKQTAQDLATTFSATWAASTDGGKSYPLTAQNCAWRAVACLTVALDPLTIALFRPASELSKPEGQILSILVSSILGAFDDKSAKPSAEETLAAIRKFLVESPLLDANALAFTKALRRMHGLELVKEDAAREALLIDLLLTYYETNLEAAYAVPAARAKAIAAKLPGGKETATNGFALDEMAAMGLFEKRLHEEGGFEAAITRYFETAADGMDASKIPLGIARAYGKGYGENSLETAAIAKGWRLFGQVLDGTFNGAEAARRSAGADFLMAFLNNPGANQPLSQKLARRDTPLKRLTQLIHDADYFVPRLLSPITIPEICFHEILHRLPVPRLPSALAAGTALNLVKQVFEAAYADAIEPLLEFSKTDVRFVPDNVPHPLPIQIADSLTPADVDLFAHHFNGIAVAMRRQDSDSSPFVHLNLASLTWTRVNDAEHPGSQKFADVPDENGAIHPILPASVDGRNALFLNYEGFPFACAAFSETVPPGGGAQASPRRPFYQYDVADYKLSPGKAAPQLAYGRPFEVFSFVTTNSGSVPPALAKSTSTPWRPAADIKAELIDKALISRVDCQRRTAIGRIALLEAAGNKGGAESRRIGAPLPDVHPLANDYPRLVLASNAAAAPGTLDLMRLSDGSGGFIFPTDVGEIKQSRILLADPDWLGAKGKLTIGLFTAPAGLDNPAAFEISATGPGPGLDGNDKLFISMQMLSTSGTDNEYRLSLQPGDGTASRSINVSLSADVDRGWFRFTLQAIEDKPVAFSFAEPEATGGAGHGVRDIPLLLLAPGADGWKSGLSQPVKGTISVPRTGFLDFERWFANADLRADVFGTPPPGTTDTPQARLFDALLTAYVMRHRDNEMANSLANLPDPSVIALRVTLAVADRLGDQPVAMLQKDISLKGLLASIASSIPSGDMLISVLKTKVFGPLNDKFNFDVEVSPAQDGQLNLDVGGKIAAKVPAGVVAQLSIAPLVETRHFHPPSTALPSVFHAGMLQYITASYPKTSALPAALAFPETALRIEVMADVLVGQDAATALAGAMTFVAPVEAARRYDLRTRDDVRSADRNNWRLVGEIDITTQRWRVTGRPIYHHVNPRQFRTDGKSSEDPVIYPALSVARRSPNDDLATFETEAFFDRVNLDAETVTQRLLPLPSGTVLQSFPWDAPSATYFRHHFTLRSRYAEALVNQGARTVPAWPRPQNPKTPDPLDEWTLRVAMLADHSRLTVTRPQMRALIPLTASTGTDATVQSTPPVLAVLQEPPFARAGLADRVSAEIRTGFGYGFDAPAVDKDQRVHILNSRKEVGPDPRLTYSPMPDERAFGLTLRAEGPIGLIFDQPSAPAPAFANSMLTLMPVSVLEDRQPVLEEHFMGVALRRHVDPNWATVNPLQQGKLILFDPGQSAWVELAGGDPFVIKLQFFDAASKALATENFLTIENLLDQAGKKTNEWEIRVAKIVLDPVPDVTEAKREVPIARFAEEHVVGLVLLHQPTAPKQYSTSILGIPNQAKNSSDSQNAQPMVLAGFEWSPRRIVGTESLDIQDSQLLLPEAVVWPGMVSAPTFLAWTRTSLDHDRGRELKFDAGGKQTALEWGTIAFSDVEARIENGSFSLRKGNTGSGIPIWAASSTLVEHRFPVHVHRHLAAISTHFADGAGRPVEVFSRADLVRAMKTPLASNSGPITCCRIVEFETPAMILTSSQSDLVPRTYKSAYFDLQSTAYPFPTGTAPGAVELFFRFVGSAEHLRKFASFEISLARAVSKKPDGTNGAPDPDDPGSLSINLAVADNGFTLGLWLRLAADKISASRLTSSGNREEVPIAGSPRPWRPLGPGFMVSIKTKEKSGTTTPGLEFWTDVSLLHSNGAASAGDFDFNWLFSSSDASDPVEAVRPQALAAMTEVQARIVAVSPPIPLMLKS